VTFLLSSGERNFLERKKKGIKKAMTGVQRNYMTNTRKKIKQSMRDLTLVFETLTPSELHFFKKDYVEFCSPLISAIETFNLFNFYYEDIERVDLMVALTRAGKRYDVKRLIANKNYRQRMIEWVVKNGIDFHPLLSLEERKRQLERISRGEDVLESKSKKRYEKCPECKVWSLVTPDTQKCPECGAIFPPEKPLDPTIIFNQHVSNAFREAYNQVVAKYIPTQKKQEIKDNLKDLEDELLKEEKDLGRIQKKYDSLRRNANWLAPTLATVVLEEIKIILGMP
jgi:hypothetical protein